MGVTDGASQKRSIMQFFSLPTSHKNAFLLLRRRRGPFYAHFRQLPDLGIHSLCVSAFQMLLEKGAAKGGRTNGNKATHNNRLAALLEESISSRKKQAPFLWTPFLSAPCLFRSEVPPFFPSSISSSCPRTGQQQNMAFCL